MYTPHPPETRIAAFVPKSLTDAARNDIEVSFDELLEMRRTISLIADEIEAFQPDLIPFFATGGIPFAFPAMHALASRGQIAFVDGSHFHMFPGLSWNGKLDGMDSESFFVSEFGELVKQHADGGRQVLILTFDATFTGNAIRKLMTALHRVFEELEVKPSSAVVSLLAIIDASRAEKSPAEGKMALSTSSETLYLTAPGEFGPKEALRDRTPTRFVRKDGKDLFDLDVTFLTMATIPTEDRAELIGAHAKKGILGISTDNVIGRLTVHCSNGRKISGTGGGSVAHNLLNALSGHEDLQPWSEWSKTAAAPPVSDSERAAYEEWRSLNSDGLTVFEMVIHPGANIPSVVASLSAKSGLLTDVEVWSLRDHAYKEFEQTGTDIESIPRDLQRKIVASARQDTKVIKNAVELFRICNVETAALEPQGVDESSQLEWWDQKLPRSN
jgi:hypothetical protein